MRALVVGASPVPEAEAYYRDLLAAHDLVIACDAAGEWCASLGRVPDVAVGDFDSATPGASDRLRDRGVEVHVFPARKDASDLDLAVDAALARGASAIAVTAAFTNRLDHTLAAVGVAMRVPEDVDVAFRDPHFSAAVLRAPVEHALSLDVAPGSIISVIALTTATGVTLQGLEYPLACASLPALSSHGISNISQATRVSVSAEQGTLLVMHMEAGSQGSYSGAAGPLPITRP